MYYCRLLDFSLGVLCILEYELISNRVLSLGLLCHPLKVEDGWVGPFKLVLFPITPSMATAWYYFFFAVVVEGITGVGTIFILISQTLVSQTNNCNFEL